MSVSILRPQLLTMPRVFTTHPPNTADSFVLYIKRTVLSSKVKIFNPQFKAKLHGTEADPVTWLRRGRSTGRCARSRLGSRATPRTRPCTARSTHTSTRRTSPAHVHAPALAPAHH